MTTTKTSILSGLMFLLGFVLAIGIIEMVTPELEVATPEVLVEAPTVQIAVPPSIVNIEADRPRYIYMTTKQFSPFREGVTQIIQPGPEWRLLSQPAAIEEQQDGFVLEFWWERVLR